MQLALGTVQFGLAYGIAGNGQAVPEAQVRSILAAAWDAGVRTLDTAAAYGDIEGRLAGLCGALPFDIVSKVPAIPDALTPSEAARWALAQAEQSRHRLGQRLRGLMCHRAEDFLGPRGAAVAPALQRWAADQGVALGASCYEPATLMTLREALPQGLALCQLPGNALDQRLAQALHQPLAGLDIHLRSAFLQGLLLMPLDQGRTRLPAAAGALQRWHGWCAARELSPLVAALSVVKSFAAVSTVLVGVESVAQWTAIAKAWAQARPLSAAELAVADPAVTDPRTWTP
jgi:aryl-alcohol dehydrogenase-like predicted oxidoreductase